MTSSLGGARGGGATGGLSASLFYFTVTDRLKRMGTVFIFCVQNEEGREVGENKHGARDRVNCRGPVVMASAGSGGSVGGNLIVIFFGGDRNLMLMQTNLPVLCVPYEITCAECASRRREGNGSTSQESNTTASRYGTRLWNPRSG